MKKVKPIYMSCEVQRRELHARLFFAVAAARRGFASVITQKLIMKVNMPKLPPGIFWHKTTTSRCTHYFELARELGSRTVGCCEEILNIPNDDSILEYGRIFFDRRSAENIDLYLAGNAVDSRIAATYPFAKIANFGNSRFEMLRGKNRKVYDPYVSHLRETLGDFVLINSSFGITGSFRSVERERQEFDYLGVGESIAQKQNYFNETHEREKRGIAIMIDLAQSLGAEGKNVIVRPHPHENPDMWRTLLKDVPNVHIDDRDTVAPWLMAANGVLQGNCTTGLEAILLNKPVGNYMAEPDHTLSAKIIPPQGWEEALKRLQRRPNGEEMHMLQESIYGIDQPVIDQTLDAFDALNPQECDPLDLLKVKYQSAKKLGDESMQRRWPPVDTNAVRGFVKSSMQTLDNGDIWLGSPGPNIIIVIPASAMPGPA